MLLQKKICAAQTHTHTHLRLYTFTQVLSLVTEIPKITAFNLVTNHNPDNLDSTNEKSYKALRVTSSLCTHHPIQEYNALSTFVALDLCLVYGRVCVCVCVDVLHVCACVPICKHYCTRLCFLYTYTSMYVHVYMNATIYT